MTQSYERQVRDRINKVGITVTVLSKSRTFNATTGRVTTSTGSDTAVQTKAAIEDFDEGVFNGSVVQSGDRKLSIPAFKLGMTPAGGDKLVMDGTTFQIITVATRHVGGSIVAYEIQARE